MLESTIRQFGGVLPLCLVVFASYVIGLYTYRLTLHPLAQFPGPKIAAVTRWYEFYYDVVLKGKYVFRLQELHKKYGPIIRISPEELHIDDPEFYDTLYAKSGRLHKHQRDVDRFGGGLSVFTTTDANLHRVRRTALNPFFSKRNVLTWQNLVHDKVNLMLKNMATFRGSGKPMTLSLAFMALSGDVIMNFCYGYDFNHVESRGFETNFHAVLLNSAQTGVTAVHFPIVLKTLMALPGWFVLWSVPLFALWFQLIGSVVRDVKRFRQQEEASDYKPQSERPNVIQHLLRSDLPAEQKADQRLVAEGVNFIGAGATTTGWMLSVASFHIVNNHAVFQRLRKELETAIPDPKASDALEWGKLEQCEYLTACIKEGIRLSYAVTNRMARLSDNVIQYGGWTIPPMTPVSMTMVDMYSNEDIFPNPKAYTPERWLNGAKTKSGEPVEKYFFGFGRGNRSCVGINLAWLELYSALAGVFRNFEFDLFDTDESDVALAHDFLIAAPKLDSKGVRVLVK